MPLSIIPAAHDVVTPIERAPVSTGSALGVSASQPVGVSTPIIASVAPIALPNGNAVSAPVTAQATASSGSSLVWTAAPSSWGPGKTVAPVPGQSGDEYVHNSQTGTYRVDNTSAGEQGPLSSTLAGALAAFNNLFGVSTPVAIPALPAQSSGSSSGVVTGSAQGGAAPSITQQTGIGGAGSFNETGAVAATQSPSATGDSGGGTTSAGVSNASLDPTTAALIAALSGGGTSGADSSQSPTTAPVYPAAQEIYGAAGSGGTTSSTTSTAVIILVAVALIGIGYYIYERYRAKQGKDAKVSVGGAAAGGKNFLEKIF